jgi:cation diffusion facilitator family transporter
VSTSGGTRAIVAALSANLGIAVVKFIAAFFSGSASMVAEGVHSLADSANQVLLLIGGKRARRAANADHPFGYGRSRYVYAFVVSIILFSVGGIFSLYEGYEKIVEPHPLDLPWLPVLVLVVAIGLESFSLRTAVKEANHTRGGQSWVQFIRRAKAPELPVVLLEDVAALIGLVLALAGVSLSWATGDGLYDGIGTLAIGVLLVAVAVVLGFETSSLLVGEGATRADADAISHAVVAGGDIDSIIHIKTLYLGPDELLVAAKVAMPAATSLAEVAAVIDAAEARIRAAVPIARVIYLEPDVRRETASLL